MQFEIYMGCGIMSFGRGWWRSGSDLAPLKLLASLEFPCFLDIDHQPPGQPGPSTLVWQLTGRQGREHLECTASDGVLGRDWTGVVCVNHHRDPEDMTPPLGLGNIIQWTLFR